MLVSVVVLLWDPTVEFKCSCVVFWCVAVEGCDSPVMLACVFELFPITAPYMLMPVWCGCRLLLGRLPGWMPWPILKSGFICCGAPI